MIILLFVGCTDDPGSPTGVEQGGYDVLIDPSDFTHIVDNPWFPLSPGTKYVYEGYKDGAHVLDTVFVTHETRVVMGVRCTVVLDRVYEDGEINEDAYDWYAQDLEGNVWYFGEITFEYTNGVVTSLEGSWEAGIENGLPGKMMLANPRVGERYRQEYKPGVVADMAEVLSVTDSISVPHGGLYRNCVRTKDWSPLDPGVIAHKFYARGVGLIHEIAVAGESERIDLIDVITE
jgi:hypothetical protein